MGCASSKRIDVALDVYRPPPSSFAVFDINAIEEPWRAPNDAVQEHSKKPSHVPAPILAKLDTLESDAPHSWDEVSKALEDLKPKLSSPAPPAAADPRPLSPAHDSTSTTKAPRRSFSFHTLEELDAKLSSKATEFRKTESMPAELKKPDPAKKKPDPEVKRSDFLVGSAPAVQTEGYKPVRESIFVMRDKQEREKEGKGPGPARWDPLSDYPEQCPPGGSDSVVLYTTTLGGVRRTYEDCNRVRAILENHRVVFDERDVSLHGKFLSELKELIGEEGGKVPRLFVKGRYVGGAEEVVGLNETGRLGRLLSWVRVERGLGRQGCEGCGGARFVPCLECGGSCKVLVGDERERCSKCNENGLIHCPVCL